MTDAQLMAKIKSQWGSLITKATALSSLPAAFLGALIANETGGDPPETRFEPAVYENLQQNKPGMSDDWYRENATSWGLTQIMGENYPGPPAELADPTTNLNFAVKMLSGFAEHFGLDLTKDFTDLFTTWNAGHPTGKTYDPNYAANGVARMALWGT